MFSLAVAAVSIALALCAVVVTAVGHARRMRALAEVQARPVYHGTSDAGGCTTVFHHGGVVVTAVAAGWGSWANFVCSTQPVTWEIGQAGGDGLIPVVNYRRADEQ